MHSLLAATGAGVSAFSLRRRGGSVLREIRGEKGEQRAALNDNAVEEDLREEGTIEGQRERETVKEDRVAARELVGGEEANGAAGAGEARCERGVAARVPALRVEQQLRHERRRAERRAPALSQGQDLRRP